MPRSAEALGWNPSHWVSDFYQAHDPRMMRTDDIEALWGDESGLVMVTDKNEGEHSEIDGCVLRGRREEVTDQESVVTRKGTERATHFDTELAVAKYQRLTSATKPSSIIPTMLFRDQVGGQVVAGYLVSSSRRCPSTHSWPSCWSRVRGTGSVPDIAGNALGNVAGQI